MSCFLCAGGSKKAPGLSDMGVTGMKSLGVRELTYKLCFAACYTMVRHGGGVDAKFVNKETKRDSSAQSAS